jgi:hypothetical protein
MRSFEGSNSAEIVSAETITLSQDSYCYATISKSSCTTPPMITNFPAITTVRAP